MIEAEDVPELITSIQGNKRVLTPQEVVLLKLNQLRLLIDPAKDREITWEEIQAVKTPHLDAYTYQTGPVGFKAGPRMIATVRGHVIVEYLKDLKRMGYLSKAREMLYGSQSPHPEPSTY